MLSSRGAHFLCGCRAEKGPSLLNLTQAPPPPHNACSDPSVTETALTEQRARWHARKCVRVCVCVTTQRVCGGGVGGVLTVALRAAALLFVRLRPVIFAVRRPHCCSSLQMCFNLLSLLQHAAQCTICRRGRGAYSSNKSNTSSPCE